MSCDLWTEKLDTYLDGELRPVEARALEDHLRQCAGCAAEGLRRVQEKRALQAAGLRFTPDAAFRARVQKKIGSSRSTGWSRRWLPLLATVSASLVIGGLLFFSVRAKQGERQLLSELVDQHVATLASSNPVDVVSSDRHTVKPWFQGKIPFTFNLPELQGSPFVLVGGRVAYLRQSPGAELIFRVRQHNISVFIFQEQALRNASAGEGVRTALSYEVRTWQRNGLRYFMIGDASSQDLDQLRELVRAAG